MGNGVADTEVSSGRRGRQPGLALLLVAVGAIPLPAHDLTRSTSNISNACPNTVRRVARGFGSPDDLAFANGAVLFSDVNAGEIGRVTTRGSKVVARGLSAPEGIVPWAAAQVAVVEQTLNRLELVSLRSNSRHTLLRFANATGLEGVDNIVWIGHKLVIPDSPYGTVLEWNRHRLRTVARGLERPTSAAAYAGGVAIADENANAVWMLRHRVIHKLAGLPKPDDVVELDHALLAVTLGDNGLWEVRPHKRHLLGNLGQPQGLLAVKGKLYVASSARNAILRIGISPGCIR